MAPNSQANASQNRPSARMATNSTNANTTSGTNTRERELAAKRWDEIRQQFFPQVGPLRQQQEQQQPEERDQQQQQEGQEEEEDGPGRRNRSLQGVLERQATRVQQLQRAREELQHLQQAREQLEQQQQQLRNNQAPQGSDEVQILDVVPGTNEENEVRVWKIIAGNHGNEPQIVVNRL